MGGFTVHLDAEMVDGGVVQTRLEADRAGSQIVRGMQAEHALRAVQHARRDKRLCALPDLLCRLKHQPHLAPEGVLVLREDLRAAEQAGRVRIMAAGVHDAGILRAVRAFMRLLDGERVDVRAQDDGSAALLFAAQRAEHAGLPDTGVRDAEPVKLLFDPLRGAEFL